MKVKVGDKVLVIAGKDKGKEGKVIKTYKKLDKLTIKIKKKERKQYFLYYLKISNNLGKFKK